MTHFILVLWQVDPLLGNGRETTKQWLLLATTRKLQQSSGVLCAVRAEML
jgi:hypothetical protein